MQVLVRPQLRSCGRAGPQRGQRGGSPVAQLQDRRSSSHRRSALLGCRISARSVHAFPRPSRRARRQAAGGVAPLLATSRGGRPPARRWCRRQLAPRPRLRPARRCRPAQDGARGSGISAMACGTAPGHPRACFRRRRPARACSDPRVLRRSASRVQGQPRAGGFLRASSLPSRAARQTRAGGAGRATPSAPVGAGCLAPADATSWQPDDDDAPGRQSRRRARRCPTPRAPGPRPAPWCRPLQRAHGARRARPVGSSASQGRLQRVRKSRTEVAQLLQRLERIACARPRHVASSSTPHRAARARCRGIPPSASG